MTDEETLSKQVPIVFVNWVDTYVGYNVSEFLSSTAVESTLKPKNEEADEEEVKPDNVENYQVIGTLRDEKASVPSHMHDIVPWENKKQVAEVVSKCSCFVIDITTDAEQLDDAQWLLNELEETLNSMTEPKVFVLVSTFLTWHRTVHRQEHTAGDDESFTEEGIPEAAALPFTEDDYRRRKPHPNYKQHWLFEKEVVRVGRIKPAFLRTCVIASGINYGKGEDVLHFFFKEAWLNAPSVTCIGQGKNVIPFIHITDLALLVQCYLEKQIRLQYILGVDGVHTRLDETLKSLSDVLTTGSIHKMSLEKIFLSELTGRQIDLLTSDILMESTVIADTFELQLIYEGGIKAHMNATVQEYTIARGLKPIRISLHGPPGSGKRTLMALLCSHFKLHPIHMGDTVREKLIELKKLASYDPEEAAILAEVGGEEEAEEEMADDIIKNDQMDYELTDDELDVVPPKVVEARLYLKTLQESLENNNGRLEDHLLLDIVRSKLLSKACQNQGFVLCGYPDTITDVKTLFAADEEQVFDEANKEPIYNTKLMPDLIVSLDAPDEFLKERFLAIPESEFADKYGSEEELILNLREFRKNNTDDNTILNYFDELEIRVEHMNVSLIDTRKAGFERLKRILGPPTNFGPGAQEYERLQMQEAEERLKSQIAKDLLREQWEREEAQLQAELLRDWQNQLAEVRQQEEELLEAEALPMRNYLMHYVMPVLTQGLMECIKVRPDDPINYLVSTDDNIFQELASFIKAIHSISNDCGG